MIFFLFLFGLLVGSFLNVVVFRMERGENFIAGRSRCLTCNHTLSWYDNIPLFSFLQVKGRCRYCKAALSWQYPLVELTTALLFSASFFVLKEYTGYIQFFSALFLLTIIAFAILITVYDLRFSLIPDVFLWGINLSTLAFMALHWVLPENMPPTLLPSFQFSFLGAFLVGGFFFLLVSLSKETWMGWGDVWLGIWGGMLGGLFLAQVFITLSFTLGAMVGLALMYRQKKTLKTEIPFAPYILLAGLLIFGCMYLAPEILYFLSPWLPGTID